VSPRVITAIINGTAPAGLTATPDGWGRRVVDGEQFQAIAAVASVPNATGQSHRWNRIRASGFRLRWRGLTCAAHPRGGTLTAARYPRCLGADAASRKGHERDLGTKLGDRRDGFSSLQFAICREILTKCRESRSSSWLKVIVP
jgi:hypothetical protein